LTWLGIAHYITAYFITAWLDKIRFIMVSYGML